MAPTPEDVRRRLATLTGPDGVTPLAEAGRISEVVVRDGRVSLSIEIDPAAAAAWEGVRRQAEQAVAAIPGVGGATVALTADRAGGQAARPQPPAGASASPRHASLKDVKRIIAVASGKGGVGKSTTAVNLALALASLSLKAAILDADIYGPSLPKLLALKGQPRILAGRTLAPMEAYGCRAMSIGFVVEAEKAMVWRGPMVASAITQMLRDVAWGTLDVLVVDMPPGTGDAQLTMAEQVPLAGAVIVSTPQDLALIDARRGVAMFRDVGVPILGLVENMSFFVCDGCGKRHHVFAHGGAREEAERLGVPFLGEVALDPLIRERSDAGVPLVVADPDGPQAAIYREIARKVRAALFPATP
jgi:ATP-binding protein involved in chromosome partitioning